VFEEGKIQPRAAKVLATDETPKAKRRHVDVTVAFWDHPEETRVVSVTHLRRMMR